MQSKWLPDPYIDAVTTTGFKGDQAFALSGEDQSRLLLQITAAIKEARRAGGAEVLAAISVGLPSETDPSAVVAASRRSDEAWFCFEQPDRERAALAALGCARLIEAAGADRFAQAASIWNGLARSAHYDGADGILGGGPVAVGGFAFADDGGKAPQWSGFAPASLIVPELSISRRGRDVSMTLSAVVTADDDALQVAERLAARAAALQNRPLAMLDPDPVSYTHLTLPTNREV